VLTVVDIPQHSGTVLTTRTAQGTIRRDGDGVQNTGVPSEVGFQLAVVQVPDLDELVPTAGDDQRVLGGRGEPDAGDPVGVVLFNDGVLALGEGVPQLDGLIAGTGDDLTVIGREGNGVHILGVSLEETDGKTSVQVPQTHGGIHGSGKGELTIRRDDGVTDGLVVTTEAAASVTRGVSVEWGQFPDDGGLIPGTRDNQVGLLVSGGNGGNPAIVTNESTTISDISHCV